MYTYRYISNTDCIIYIVRLYYIEYLLCFLWYKIIHIAYSSIYVQYIYIPVYIVCTCTYLNQHLSSFPTQFHLGFLRTLCRTLGSNLLSVLAARVQLKMTWKNWWFCRCFFTFVGASLTTYSYTVINWWHVVFCQFWLHISVGVPEIWWLPFCPVVCSFQETWSAKRSRVLRMKERKSEPPAAAPTSLHVGASNGRCMGQSECFVILM